MTNKERLIVINQKLKNLKQTPFMQKANAAELIIEDTVFLLQQIVDDLEGLKNG